MNKIIKTFKYLNPKRLFVRLKTFNEKAKQLDENPYSLFLDWILDIIQYGFVATAIALLVIWQGWLGVGISFGMMFWLYKTVLRETKEIIKE